MHGTVSCKAITTSGKSEEPSPGPSPAALLVLVRDSSEAIAMAWRAAPRPGNEMNRDEDDS